MLTKHNYYGHEIEILMPLHFSRGKHSHSRTSRWANKTSIVISIDLDSPLEAHRLSCSHDILANDGTVIDVKCGSISDSLV